MERTLEQTHRDVVTALIMLGGNSMPAEVKKRLTNNGYTTLEAELAIQRSTNQRNIPYVQIGPKMELFVEDHLADRCAELHSWKKNGSYKGYLLEAYGKYLASKRKCAASESLEYAKKITTGQAIERLALSF